MPLDDGSELSLLLAPTPRWPDLMMVYHNTSKLLFTSKFFSAHVAPYIVSQVRCGPGLRDVHHGMSTTALAP